MSGKRADFAIFALRTEIGRRSEQARQRFARYMKMRECCSGPLERSQYIMRAVNELEERDRDIDELKAAIERLRG